MIDDFNASFVEEVRELLHSLEEDLITLEQHPEHQETINSVFRVMHTLKGSAGMCGFNNIQDLTHEYEGMYELIREGLLRVDTGIIDLTLQGKDLINSMLNGENVSASQAMDQIRQKIKNSEGSGTKSASPYRPSGNIEIHHFVVLFSPDKEVFERGLNPEKTLAEVEQLGCSLILAHEKKSSWNKQKETKICHTAWEIYLKTANEIKEIEEAFLFYDQCEFEIFDVTAADQMKNAKLIAALKKLHGNKIAPSEHISGNLEKITLNDYNSDTHDKSVEGSKKDNAPETSKTENDGTISVSSRKLDELMNLVSELVTITATLEVHASSFNDPAIDNSIENIGKLTKKFRNNALDLRLVPVGTLLSRFKRQVRDLSRELGKKVNLLIEGQDIEIDKTILKAIESPLQHVIRNSIDHGLESEEERLAKGKLPEGLLKITAFYSGANVIMQVQDDGRGINLERVLECAIKKGLVLPDQDVTKQELINLILEPGFTTMENISMVSGRGVGMDVVRKELNGVGGGLEIFTEKDLGTSITMKLPTTLTIIDTLMIEVAKSSILIPIMDIEYCFKENYSALFNKDNKYIQYKNSPIPLISLRGQFKYAPYESEDAMVIVINKFDRKYAIVADRIIGEHQAVIKPLGELFMNQPYFSGGSIMTDGKLALILDTNFLFSQATRY